LKAELVQDVVGRIKGSVFEITENEILVWISRKYKKQLRETRENFEKKYPHLKIKVH